MSQTSDILILGGGIIGLTTAYYLAQAGAQVSVLDKGDMGQEASWAGAGIIPPGNPQYAITPHDKLLAHGSAAFAALSAELQQRTGIDNGYRVCGGIEIHEGDESEVLEKWKSLGIRAEALYGSAVHRCEPQLSPQLLQVYHLPDMAQVRNPRHLKALLAACASLGVALRPGCPAYSLTRKQNRITGVQTDDGGLVAKRYLIAAGAWSESLLAPLGWRPGIHPVRGQIVLLNSAVPLITHIIEENKRYLVPRMDGRVLVGSTEENVAFDKRTTAGAIRELIEFAMRLVPHLSRAAVERCWAGLRPGSSDGLPFLGAVPGFDNLFVGTGHSRAGLQMSPVTGRVLRDVLLDKEPEVPLGAFSLERTTFQS